MSCKVLGFSHDVVSWKAVSTLFFSLLLEHQLMPP